MFLHLFFLHLRWSLTLIGESFICMTLLGATYYIYYMGLPYDTFKVVNRCLGWQFSSVDP